MGRRPCCDKVGLKKGPWTAEEDKKLVNFLASNGHCCWRVVPKLAGLLRCGKSCRLRWTNYLRPDLKRGVLSDAEESLIINLHARLGNRWSKIASNLPGRTDNEIKNYWNTHIKKKLRRMGIDPATHLPIPEPQPSEPSGQLNNGTGPAKATAKSLPSDQHKRNQFLPQENLKPNKKEAEISERILNNAPQSEEFKQNNLLLTEIPCKMEANNPDAQFSQVDTTLLLPGSFEGLWEYGDNITDCFESAQYGVTWFDSQSSTDHAFETPEVIPASSESSSHFLLQSVENNFPPWEQPATSQRVFPLHYQN